MAIYHFQAQMIKRSSGRSSVAAAAYRSGEKMIDERTGITHDYTNKSDVHSSEMLAPEGAPPWCTDRAKVWNNAESAARQHNEQVAREIVIALPKELSFEQRQEITREFVQDNFVEKGMIADVAYHNQNGKNPHAHIMCSTRKICENGFGLKDRTWNQKGLFIEWRKALAEITNKYLQIAGFDIRVDHQSLKDRGIPLEANIHLGPNIHNAIAQGDAKSFELYNEALSIMERNGDRIINDPSIATKLLEDKHSTFSDYEVAKIANENSATVEQFNKVSESIKSSKDIIGLGKDDRGHNIYSTKNTIVNELKLAKSLDGINEKSTHRVPPEISQKAIAEVKLSDSQNKAFEHIMSDGNLKVVQGIAGTGKSFLMGKCADAWTESGYNVVGGSLAGVAAKGLSEETVSPINPEGIESRTLSSWMARLDDGSFSFGKKDIFILDEAGMVGTKEMQKLASALDKAGAKLVLLGDPEQAQPIGPGNPMRHAIDSYSSKILEDVIRQKSPEMRVATVDFGMRKTDKALSTYDKLGAFNFEASTRDSAICKMTEAYLETKYERSKSIMLAHSNKDVLKLNEHARDILKQSGKLKNGVEIGITTRLGVNIPKEFASSDRILFLAKEESMGVENGTFGSVVFVDGKSMVVKLDGDDEKIVSFNHKKFNKFDHGYAATIHKAQGVTKDRTYFLATPGVDKNLTYVACSRHKNELGIYASTEDFANKQELFNKLSSSNEKSMAIDIAKENGIDIEKFIKNDISLSDIKDRTLEKALGCIAEAKRAIVKVYDNSKALCGTVTDKVDMDKLGKYMEIKDKDGVCHLIDTKELKLELEKGDKIDIDKGALGKDKDIIQDKAQELQKDFVQRIDPQISI